MPLIEGQMQIRDLVMGQSTPYLVMQGTNPWTRSARVDSTGARPWAHGSWSGAEWLTEVVVPITVLVQSGSAGEWLTRQQTMQAAFRPIGDSVADVELRWMLGGTEYVMFGRPRMVEPDVVNMRGETVIRAAFVALDPFIYAGAETVVDDIALPTYSGGLSVPFTVPFTIAGTITDGYTDITNNGTADTGLLLRIDGPVESPSVWLIHDDGTVQRLDFNITLGADQWLDIDTKERVVLLNGTVSRRGQTAGDWPMLPTGTHRLRWNAAIYNPDARLTVRYRSAWW